MADAFSVNERVPTTNALYAVWRLTRVLITAGWTVVQSSNGTTYGAADYWGTYAGLGTSAWIVLAGPGGRHLCFWRSTTSTDNGKILYVPGGQSGFTFASASASSPGTIPTNAQYVRGSSGTFNTWFGSVSSTYPIRYLHVAAKDVSDGSWWLQGTLQEVGGAKVHHTLGFFSLYSVNTNDQDPYMFYTAAGAPTTDFHTNFYNDGVMTDQESTWYGWCRNSVWKAYRPATMFSACNQRNPYAAGTPYALLPFAVGKTESGYTELKGVVKHARRGGVSNAATDRGYVYGDGTAPFKWVIMGADLTTSPYGASYFFWDGVTPSLAFEY
jgi:hypothetical protein